MPHAHSLATFTAFPHSQHGFAFHCIARARHATAIARHVTAVVLCASRRYGIATKQAELNGSELSIQAMMDSNPYLRK